MIFRSKISTYNYSSFKVAAVLAVLACLILAGACGASKTEAPQGDDKVEAFVLDVAAAGERLHSELEYRDDLEALDQLIVCALLGLRDSDVDQLSSYFSSGATAEEILVFKAVDEDALKSLRSAVETRVEDQKKVYVSYAPEEIAYLDGAVIVDRDLYLIYCVSADSQKANVLVNEILRNR